MLNVNKNWYSVELVKTEADMLKEYLRKASIYFEPSEVGHLVHFECLMAKEECDFVNDFLYNVVTGGVVGDEKPTA